MPIRRFRSAGMGCVSRSVGWYGSGGAAPSVLRDAEAVEEEAADTEPREGYDGRSQDHRRQDPAHEREANGEGPQRQSEEHQGHRVVEAHQAPVLNVPGSARQFDPPTEGALTQPERQASRRT